MIHTTAFPKGRITLVGAGPGSADLLTLRAVARLQAADVIFFDRLVDADVLAMAGDRAERVFVGKEVGHHAWPQSRINAEIVRAALSGQNVVRLKSGDPSVFGRAAEEIAAARAVGLEVEVVPGITAASAAAARLCHPLTERGVTDRLVLATGTCGAEEEWSGLSGLVQPGTTIVLYMAMRRLPVAGAELRRAGLPLDTSVTICAQVEKRGETHLHTTVAEMAADAALAGIRDCAVVFIRVPKKALAKGARVVDRPEVTAVG
ncbi:uroporphyrinogen-III C-methyltransferase [Falsirhodobacter sp. 20TX0035]|uniref:uroporphyrinogen-III C-methyltransferase n=1 Tax=Falsirhodobacter sp. 20TX0035 TaxID=3022019 RepID=UPI002330500E|nr:uroporphyrinogen-III C-methyltransferase [Falsirhodobacter sp. 20TX0035]MDB6454066.1 uroporphyrinogen-III C-methyltransferase [Falsirhodobacter sp. 20TX0035]